MSLSGKFLTGLMAGFTGFTVAVATTVNLPTVAQLNRRYFCDSNFNPTYGYVPATIIRSEHGQIPIIYWVSDWIKNPEWPAEARCEAVADRLQRHSDNGTLNNQYMHPGQIGNYPVICIVTGKEGTCQPEDILVTLEPGTDAEEVLFQMTDLRRLASNRPVELSDDLFFYFDGEAYINMGEFDRQIEEFLKERGY